MARDEIHVGDVGTVIKALIKDQDNAVVNISTATTKTLYLRKPDGTAKTFAGTFTTDGSDGYIQYTLAATTDIDVEGPWVRQWYFAFSGNSTEFWSDKAPFTVYPNLG